ncbi:L-serine ammonia-lyase [Microbacterium hominis]|uniref:L-serine ammonia-lyase n=1 Tax=Microbacterium TaxID=33882 RepID=UPI00168BFDCE|nr:MULTISPECIES: L-serine ammonia-lyase [Microbacterium]QOC26497.1 L-serine ammonia-lyase [Microbacterium hominis]QOC27672.1 L-serine ammonia-lyase [Microbacterium hominis]QYF97195.1 L-serine ammonia-lyase [Microbacterium sp. PAMC21962]
MYVSALDLFSLGIGPSSSHTVGPMRAALAFVDGLESAGIRERVTRFVCRLHGSLAATGVGHGTPDAVIAGLRGLRPETVDPAHVHGEWARLCAGEDVRIGQVALTEGDIAFAPRERHHGHPNALTLTAFDGDGELASETYLSIGGGFVRRVGESGSDESVPESVGDDGLAGMLPSRYRTMAELLAALDGRTIAEVAWADEVALRGADRAAAGLDLIWQEMRACVERGLNVRGVLPGRLGVPRRAAAAWARLASTGDPAETSEALSLYAMAVNEENAAGGRVVTAPTNGAAGVLPAVMYHACRAGGFDRAEVRVFLLTATAVGSIIKANASISGAEAGCQAEVGSACAMAAAGLTAIRGGTPAQIENAAEIAMEHHLGMTCDPVGGLVQIPCIERNAVAAATALTASRLALLGDGTHVVTLDTVIETMRQTGADMSARYKETSEAGLAVNVVEC